ncbi:MAG: hypothetical protein HY840_00890 [Bacteroidetes bacterium]|nr:hypothetical protein [Bacteroidota bacterium]
MQDKKAILTPGTTYHIYNRANGNEKIFANEGNYFFFLEKHKHYISSIADTFCYCLMPNHFHFLIRIKSISQLCQGYKPLTELNGKSFQGSTPLTELNEAELSNFLSRQFSHLLNGYTQAFNKQQSRKGSLFMRPFKRKRISDENYLRKLVHYIHYNPVKAGICSKPEEWKHSSYNAILNLEGFQNLQGFILKEEVIEWFGDKENFIYCHRFPQKETGIDKF